MKRRNTRWIRYFTRGHHPLLYIDSVMLAHRDQFHRYFGVPNIQRWVRHSGSLWVDADEMERVYAAIRAKLDTSWPLTVLARMERDVTALVRLTEREQPRETFQRLIAAVPRPWMATYFPIIIGKVIEEEVAREITNLSSRRQTAIIRALNTPSAPTVQQRYYAALRVIPGLTSRTTASIIQRFGWIKSYVMDSRPLTPAHIAADWQHARGHRSERPAVLNRFGGRVGHLVMLGRRYSWFRDWRLFAISRFFFVSRSRFEKSSDALGLSWEEFRQLRVTEALSGRFKRRAIVERQREFGITLLNGRVKVVTGSGLKALKARVAERVERSDSVQGVTARPGLVRGRVRIANAYNFHNIKPGEIVVTPETTPESVPHLRGVRAIVTDEGGITSHAAIIARELGIPCVIGTKVATQIFKNGDRVEVDATKGMVRKLK